MRQKRPRCALVLNKRRRSLLDNVFAHAPHSPARRLYVLMIPAAAAAVTSDDSDPKRRACLAANEFSR